MKRDAHNLQKQQVGTCTDCAAKRAESARSVRSPVLRILVTFIEMDGNPAVFPAGKRKQQIAIVDSECTHEIPWLSVTFTEWKQLAGYSCRTVTENFFKQFL